MVGPMSTSLQQEQDGGPTLAFQRFDKRAIVGPTGERDCFFSLESITNINAHIYQCSTVVWYFLSKKKAIPAHLVQIAVLHV